MAACTSADTRRSTVIIEPTEVRLHDLEHSKGRGPRKVPRKRLPCFPEGENRLGVVRRSAAGQLPLFAEEAWWLRRFVRGQIENDKESGRPATPEGFGDRHRSHTQRPL